MKISVSFPDPNLPPATPYASGRLREIEQHIQQALLAAYSEIHSNFTNDIIESISIKMEYGTPMPSKTYEIYASVRITITFKKIYLVLSVQNEVTDILDWLVQIPYNNGESIIRKYKNKVKSFVIESNSKVRERWALRLREIAEDVLRKAK